MAILKVNTGDQSLGFNYINTSRNLTPTGYLIHEFGLKAKPTEGYALVLKNNELSPGIKSSYALTKIQIFSKDSPPLKKAGFFDWGGIEINFDVNKYSLFKKDTIFANQFYSKKSKPLSFFLNYNYLVTSGAMNSRLLFSLKGGFTRRNNYSDLNSLDVQDTETFTDPTSLISRQTISKKTVKTGDYQEYNAFASTISLSFLTKTDPVKIPNPLYKIKKKTIVKFRADTAKYNCTETVRTLKIPIITRDTILSNGKYIIDVQRTTIALKDTLRSDCSEKITLTPYSVDLYDTIKVDPEIPNPDIKRLRLGVTTYIKNFSSSSRKPDTKLGAIVFLTRQAEKTGVRTPILGFNIQAEDPFDIKRTNLGLQDRISIGFTTVFTL